MTAYDAYGNVATGYTGTVHFTSTDGQADAAGQLHLHRRRTPGSHTFSATLKTAGTQSITATDTVTGTITGSQTHLCRSRRTATHFTVTGFTSPTTAGVAHSVTVTAHDAYGNVATGYTGTVHFTSSDGQAVAAGQLHLHQRRRRDNGVHTFTTAPPSRRRAPSRSRPPTR